jgi:hypothetical protein
LVTSIIVPVSRLRVLNFIVFSPLIRRHQQAELQGEPDSIILQV